MTINSLYAIAIHPDNGKSEEALAVFLDIVNRDASQEKARHEAGKIPNRLEMCADSFEHYERYVKRFPGSDRGLEGHEIAKNC
jgi:hypothetical protein